MELIEDGNLVLDDDENNRMEVPAQSVERVKDKPKKDRPMMDKANLIPMVLLAIGLTIGLIVIICLICAICLKKKKQMVRSSISGFFSRLSIFPLLALFNVRKKPLKKIT